MSAVITATRLPVPGNAKLEQLEADMASARQELESALKAEFPVGTEGGYYGMPHIGVVHGVEFAYLIVKFEGDFEDDAALIHWKDFAATA